MLFCSKFMKYALVISGVGIAMSPPLAKAGFDWTPPPVQAPVVQPSIETISPSPEMIPPMNSGPLTPEPDAVVPQPSAPLSIVDEAPLPDSLPVPGMKSLPAKVTAPIEPVSPPSIAPSPTVPAPIVSAAGGMVEGFGKDIPLALALRDIVPSSYAYVFQSGDMAGRKVSWRGGKQWQQVLQDALSPLNLTSVIQGNVVAISSQSLAAVPVYAPVDTLISAAVPAPSTPPVTMIARRPDTAPAPIIAQPSSAALPVVDLTVVRKWEAKPGVTLRDALGQWSRDANVELNWSTAYDYPINNAFYFEGNYGEAVDSLLSSYGGENPAPKGRLYPNLPDGPSVLMVN